MLLICPLLYTSKMPIYNYLIRLIVQYWLSFNFCFIYVINMKIIKTEKSYHVCFFMIWFILNICLQTDIINFSANMINYLNNYWF